MAKDVKEEKGEQGIEETLESEFDARLQLGEGYEFGDDVDVWLHGAHGSFPLKGSENPSEGFSGTFSTGPTEEPSMNREHLVAAGVEAGLIVGGMIAGLALVTAGFYLELGSLLALGLLFWITTMIHASRQRR